MVSFNFGSRRQGNRSGGSIAGLVFFVAGAGLLGWNEHNAVDQRAVIEEINRDAISISSEQVDPSNERKAVHLAGPATTEVGVQDPLFGVGGDYLRLVREVDMYQWVKDKDSDGNTRYQLKWRSDQHREKDNPDMPFQSETFYADDASIGAFHLTEAALAQLDATQLAFSGELPEEIAALGFKVEADYLYLGKGTLSAPKLGDVRAQVLTVAPGPVSLLGRQEGEAVNEYVGDNGNSVFQAELGMLDKNALVAAAHADASFWMWLFRGLGFFAMTVGMAGFFSGLVRWASFIPVIGPLLAQGTGLMGALLGAVLALLLFISAWLFVRPLLAVSLLALVAGLVFWMVKTKRREPEMATGPVGAMPPPPPR
jgi:Transmembrane protein 43